MLKKKTWTSPPHSRNHGRNKNIIETLKANLEDMAYSNININLGIDRQVSSKEWEKNGNKRTYLAINCYTASGRYKGAYKCGYVDMVTNEYVCGRYDDVDAMNKEYVGR